MLALQILGIVIFMVWSALAGVGLLVNIFTGPGQAGFWGSMFHRCTWKEVLVLLPGLFWILPLTLAAYLLRKFK